MDAYVECFIGGIPLRLENGHILLDFQIKCSFNVALLQSKTKIIHGLEIRKIQVN